VHAYLTDQARDMLKDAPVPLQERFAAQFDDLQEWEKTMIISSLQRIAQMMDAQHVEAAPILDVGSLDRHGIEADPDAIHLNES
jgi:hypothetical protein